MSFYLFHGKKIRGGQKVVMLEAHLDMHVSAPSHWNTQEKQWTHVDKSFFKTTPLPQGGSFGETDHNISPGDRSLSVYVPHCPVVHKKHDMAIALKGTSSASLTHFSSDECTWTLVKSWVGLLWMGKNAYSPCKEGMNVGGPLTSQPQHLHRHHQRNGRFRRAQLKDNSSEQPLGDPSSSDILWV